MTKVNAEKLAGEVIPLLREMFGEGIAFSCTEYYKSNETLTGIALKLPGCTTIPTVRLDDMPDNATAEDIANIAAAVFQEALQNFREFPILPEMTRETVLENVVLQALSRKRNRQLLKTHPHIPFLDLAGIFRVPVGPFQKDSLSTMLITNQIVEKLETIYAVPYGVAPCVSGLRVFGKGNGSRPEQAEASIVHSSPLDFVVSTGDDPDVVGYNVLWGNPPEQLYHSWMVMGTRIDRKRIGALMKGREYFVRVDAFNENGITEGKVEKI